MIVTRELKGRLATIAYIDDQHRLVDKDDATFAKVIYADGDISYMLMGDLPTLMEEDTTLDDAGWDESKVSRGQPDNAGKFGPGGYSAKTKVAKARARAKAKAKPVGKKRTPTEKTAPRSEADISRDIGRLRAKAGSDKEIDRLFQEKRALRTSRVAAAREADRQAAKNPIRSRTLEETLERARENGRTVAEQVEHEETQWRKSPEGKEARAAEIERIRAVTERGAKQWAAHLAESEGRERSVRPMTLPQKITQARLEGRKTEMAELQREQRLRGERARLDARLRGEPAPSAAEAHEQNKKKTYKLEKSKTPAKREDFADAGIRMINTASEDELVAKWNDKIGIDPDTFKHAFTGGLGDQVKMTISEGGGIFYVSGRINDENGHYIGTFDRHLKPNDKSAYSAYFKMEDDAQGGDVGKKLLAGNVDVYEALGYDSVRVSANIDIGGYAWARYGYVPTPQAWRSLSAELERKIERGEGHRMRSGGGRGSEMEAEEWSQLSDHQQSETQRMWMRDSRSEFVDSEISNWRDNGGALDDAKYNLANGYQHENNDWANDALIDLIDRRKAAQTDPFPLNNEQILAALKIKDYDIGYDGRNDPEWEWDEDEIKAALKVNRKGDNQRELPGLERDLTKEERIDIEEHMTKEFNKQAERDESDVEPPEHILNGVDDYQSEFWDQKDDSEMLRLAIDYGQGNIELDDDETTEEVDLDLPEDEEAELLDILRASDPKGIWKIANSSRGKELLINSSWSGVLDFKDKESYDQFRKYVSRKKKKGT